MVKTPSIKAILISGSEKALEKFYKENPNAKIVDVDWKMNDKREHFFLIKQEVMIEKE